MYIQINKILAVVETAEGWTILFEGGETINWVAPACVQSILKQLK